MFSGQPISQVKTGFDNYKIAVHNHVRMPNFGVHNVLGQILKTVQASYLLPSDFPNNFL